MKLAVKSLKDLVVLLKRTFHEWTGHEAPRMGAALAFYTVLSLAPLVILVVSVIALVFSHSDAQAQIVSQFRQMVGDEGARVVETVLTNAKKTSTGLIATVFGLITLLFGASGVFVELRSALNKLWDVKPRETSGLIGMIKDRFLSFGMVLAIGFLLLVSLMISAGLSAAGKFFGSLGIFPPWVWEAINFFASLAVVASVFALIFRFVADIRIPWNAIWKGAIATAVLFTIGKTAIGLYLGKAGVGSAYGAAGSLVVVTVWVYYSAQIFFFGAEFTHLVAGAHEPKSERQGIRAVPEPVRPGYRAQSEHASSPRPGSVLGTIVAAALIGTRLIRNLGSGTRRR